ncbi:MAG: hypothetical protein ACLFO1_10285 [Spirochaetaceae bacterium]
MIPRTLVLSIIFALIALQLPALEYSDTFYGINLESDIAVATDAQVDFSERFQMTRLTGVFTLGTRRSFPFRFRMGVGWWPRQPVALMAGTELAIFERLNRAKARMFGVYTLADGNLLLDDGIDYQLRLSLALQIPVSLAGGMTLGVGIDNHRRFYIRVCSAVGAYPILSQ